MRRFSVILIMVVFLLSTVPVQATIGVSSTTGWTAVSPSSNAFDYLMDQQTGSGSVSQDLVGSTTYPVFYMKFDDQGTSSTADDEVGFRFRISNYDSTSGVAMTYNNYAFIGIDTDLSGSIDLFTGIYNPDNNGSKSISIYSSDPTKTNTSPSTTGFGSKLYELAGRDVVKGTNWNIQATGDGSNFNGDADYFLTFKLPLSAFNTALSQVTAATTAQRTITTSTSLRFVIGTASQANSYNQDMGGVGKEYKGSTISWSDLGVFLPTSSITGAKVNIAPVASNLSYTIASGGSVVVTLQGSDPDGDPIDWSQVTTTRPSCGTLTRIGSTNQYTYNHNSCSGDVTFQYTVSDGSLSSIEATVTIKVGTNTPPVATSATYNITTGGSVQFSLQGTDNNLDSIQWPTLTYTGTCGTLKGPTKPGTAGVYTFTDNGTCSRTELEFTVSDGSQIDNSYTANTARITINTASNVAPVAQSQVLDVQQNGSVTFSLLASDADNDPITWPTITAGRLELGCGTITGPSVSGTSGVYTYTDNGTCTTEDMFHFFVNDPYYSSNLASVTFRVVVPQTDPSPAPYVAPDEPKDNLPPVAPNVLKSTPKDTPYNGSLKGTDPNNDSMWYQVLTPPSKGDFTFNPDGTFTLTPPKGFVGKITFTYQACDTWKCSAPMTFTLVVGESLPQTGIADDYGVLVVALGSLVWLLTRVKAFNKS